MSNATISLPKPPAANTSPPLPLAVVPEDVGRVLGLEYSPDVLERLKSPHEISRRELMKPDTIFVPGPPQPMSLAAIVDRWPEVFVSDTHEWRDVARQQCTDGDVVLPKWHWINRRPRKETFSKKWSDQLDCFETDIVVTNVAEVAWLLLVAFKVKGIRLLSDCYVRVSSEDDDRCHLIVGDFSEDGITILRDTDDRCHLIGLWPCQHL